MWNIGCGVTTKCNMKCEFCYSKNARNGYVEINFNALKNFIKFNNLNINAINYGTGENVLCNKWFDLIDYIRGNFPMIQQSLTTNGTVYQILQNKICYDIFNKAVDEVDISLDYCDEHKHNITRGINTAYKGALNTIKMCKAMRKKVSIVCVALDKTFDEENLEGLIEICKENDIFLRINILRTSDKNYAGLSIKKLFSGLNYLFRNMLVVSVSDVLISALYLNKKAIDNTGVKSIRILPDGWITPATYLITDEWKAKSIEEEIELQKLSDIDMFKIFNVSFIPKECEGCLKVDICRGGTYDRRLLVYGSLKEKDPLCPYKDNHIVDINADIEYFKGDIPSIHNDYLPTIILKPKK